MRPRRVDPRERDRAPQTRVNEMIRVREVLLIDEKGDNLGVTPVQQAQAYALEKSLDLVEISPQARPPVCRVMDYGKWKYEQNVKAKEARRHRSTIVVKEIKFRPKIGESDYQTKKNHVRRFLDAADKVKVTIMFRGREMAHPELGRKILMRVAEDVKDLAVVETPPNLEGRNMTMMLGPLKKKESKAKREEDAETASGHEAEVEGSAAPEAAPAPAAPAEAPAAKAEAPAKEAAAPVEETPAEEAPAEDVAAAAPADAGTDADVAGETAAEAPAADDSTTPATS
jgi:translation initiation factor IF-3